jgi:outer membrane lipoprotein SlyB
VSPASAAGCLSGAAIGAGAGHLAGHHAVLGGVAGCAVGHHHAKTVAKREQQNAYDQGRADATNAPNAATSTATAPAR